MHIEPSQEVDALAHAVIGAAITVHKQLGPGFMESIYERALAIELTHRQIPFAQQAVRHVLYRGEIVGEHRLDLIVGDRLLVELKAVDAISNHHFAQTLSYLRATEFELALILNFNAVVLREGIRRIVPRTAGGNGI